MMDRMLERACSDSDLVRPVFWEMADTNSAFLKLMTSSLVEEEVEVEDFFFFLVVDFLVVVADFFLVAYITVVAGRAVLLAPLSLRGVMGDDDLMTSVEDGGVNASMLTVATNNVRITERSVLFIFM